MCDIVTEAGRKITGNGHSDEIQVRVEKYTRHLRYLFLGQKKGATKAEMLSRAVEHGEMKDAAAQLTQMTDEMLHHVMEESRLERLRIQQEAEGSRELPMVNTR